MKQKLLVVYFNVALFCVLLVGMELTGQILFLLVKGYPLYQSAYQKDDRLQWHSKLFEQHPYLVGRLKSNARVEQDGKIVTTTAGHTRWTGAVSEDTNAIRVAVVGGSTTFGAGVTDSESWPARLQHQLGPGYSVTNYGLLGYSTAEAIVQMALVVPESRAQIVVLYEGWNDIRSYHDSNPSADYFSHGMRQFGTLGIERPQQEPLLTRLADISAICRFAVVVSRKLAAPLPQPDSSGTVVFSTPDPFVDRIYLRNLTTLKALAQHSGAYAMFVPQVLNRAWFAQHQGGDWWTPHIDNRAMPALIRRFDRIMNEACGPNERGCTVLNEVIDQPWGPDDFIDEGHFSGKGGEAFAKLLAAEILEYVGRNPASFKAR